MDITDSLAPASDQLDAIDLATSGPQTFTVVEVTKGNAEQPVQIKLAEFPRVWRPSKGMRRVLAACWGTDASTWAGHRVRLFNDPDVMFGKERTGGVRVSHVSHIDAPKSVPMLVSRGRSSTYVVEPLPDSPGAEVAPTSEGKPSRAAPDTPSPVSDAAPGVDITADTIAECESIPTLRGWWKKADAGTRTLIEARVKALEEAALGGES